MPTHRPAVGRRDEDARLGFVVPRGHANAARWPSRAVREFRATQVRRLHARDARRTRADQVSRDRSLAAQRDHHQALPVDASSGSTAADPPVTAYVLAAGRPRVSAPEQRVRLSQAAAEPVQERDWRGGGGGGVRGRRGCWWRWWRCVRGGRGRRLGAGRRCAVGRR